MFTNLDAALCDEAPTHRLPPADVLDDDRLPDDLDLSDAEVFLLAKSLKDDLLLRLLDRPSSAEYLTSGLFTKDPTDAYDLVTLDEVPGDLPDLVLLAKPSELTLSDFILSSLDKLLLEDQDATDLLDDEPLDLSLDDSSA